jgi:RNA polymerase sigma-70 factor (ECF subfamily)
MADADERLLVEAAQRDASKFADLYERHFERVYAFAAGRLRDRDAAEDVTAEVFQKALASLKQYEWRGLPFGAWLIRIASNAIADRSKRAAREVVDSGKVSDTADDDPWVDRFEERARLFQLVKALPADQRVVIVERFVNQRSIREIAQNLKKTEGAVKQLQYRALQSLRTRMEGADA